jgi:hypothetical protein
MSATLTSLPSPLIRPGKQPIKDFELWSNLKDNPRLAGGLCRH